MIMVLKKNYSRNLNDSVFELIPSKIFLKQLDSLSSKTRISLKNKLLLLKENPFRNKRIIGYSLLLFRIRFVDMNKSKRVIYLVDKSKIKLICILDRKNNYSDLKFYLKNYLKSKL